MKNFKVNQEACIGCGACQAIAEEIFEISDEGLAQVIEGKGHIESMEENQKSDAMDALEGCPTSAIVIEESNEKA